VRRGRAAPRSPCARRVPGGAGSGRAVEAAALAAVALLVEPADADTAVVWFQAGIFAAGRFVAPLPDSYEHFAVLNAFADPRG